MSINVTLMIHPWLYAGTNDWAMGCDEINSAGVNDIVSPLYLSAATLTEPLLVEYPFVIDCADFSVPVERVTFSVPYENRKERAA